MRIPVVIAAPDPFPCFFRIIGNAIGVARPRLNWPDAAMPAFGAGFAKQTIDVDAFVVFHHLDPAPQLLPHAGEYGPAFMSKVEIRR